MREIAHCYTDSIQKAPVCRLCSLMQNNATSQAQILTNILWHAEKCPCHLVFIPEFSKPNLAQKERDLRLAYYFLIVTLLSYTTGNKFISP